MRGLGIALYILSALPIAVAAFAWWFLQVWGFNPLGGFPLYALALVFTWLLWFTGRVLRSKPTEKQ
jgi:hypothetical protein